jgi:FtsZ-binding cell division protein ZapB
MTLVSRDQQPGSLEVILTSKGGPVGTVEIFPPEPVALTAEEAALAINKLKRDVALARAEVAELQRQLTVAHRVEDSLRANDARWARRLKALEARLEHIMNIAGGHALVEEGEG